MAVDFSDPLTLIILGIVIVVTFHKEILRLLGLKKREGIKVGKSVCSCPICGTANRLIRDEAKCRKCGTHLTQLDAISG